MPSMYRPILAIASNISETRCAPERPLGGIHCLRDEAIAKPRFQSSGGHDLYAPAKNPCEFSFQPHDCKRADRPIEADEQIDIYRSSPHAPCKDIVRPRIEPPADIARAGRLSKSFETMAAGSEPFALPAVLGGPELSRLGGPNGSR